MKDVLLFSGGIDSLSAWFYMNKPRCIYIDLKTKYSKKEIKNIHKLEKMIPNLKVDIIEGINLGQFEEGINAFIPYRNLMLFCIAANYGDRIILAGIEDDLVEDKNLQSFNVMQNCLNFISPPEKNVKFYSPFWEMSKSEIIKWMLKNVTNAEKYLRTSISCYSLTYGQCGECPSCLRKAIAFEACKLKLDFFDNEVKSCKLIKNYNEKMKDKNSKYTQKRIKESLKVFKSWGWDI